MKKTFIIIATLFTFLTVQAQENYIISTLYDPDSCFTLDYHWTKDFDNAYAYSDTVKIDINQDGIGDVLVFLEPHDAGGYMSYVRTAAPQWKLSLTDATIINESLNWYSTVNLSVNYEFNHFAFRHQADDGIHYGWASIENTAHCVNCICCFGYCTLPDTPIQWGQTELWGVEETEANAFATLQPNPTTGLVSVTGETATEVQVFNPLGQLVKTVQNTNEISLEGLPQGVYLLRVTTEDGKVFSDKVVKE